MAVSTTQFAPRNFDTFKHWFKDYCQNSSIAGCIFYVADGMGPKERIFWIAGHVICIIGVVIMIVNTTLDFAEIPTVTTPETSNYPIQDVDFPGVAICDLNKINYSAAMELAKEILEYNHYPNFTLPEVTDMLKYLGHLYLFVINDDEKVTVGLLHKLLVKKYKNYASVVLKELTPSCQWILQYCSWDGIEQYCDDIFSIRKTGDGYCCTFNYARKSDDFSGKNKDAQTWAYDEIKHTRITGSRFGLTVLVRSDTSNDHYKILPALGYEIMIYPSMDFPDPSSGGVRQVVVQPRTESSLTLQATPFYSVPAVLRYSVISRGCLFNDEVPLIFGEHYSYSDCIVHCRIADILKLCDCVPFFYPTPSSRARVCDLRDLDCLSKDSARWMRVSPKPRKFKVPSVDISPDVPNGDLNCSECFPACKDVLYEVSVNSVPLRSSTVRMGRLTYNLNDGQSIVNIFFKNDGTTRLQQDVLFYWYDLLSNYGGFCGLFLGVSIISAVEVLYFFTLRLYNRKDEIKEGGDSRIISVKSAKTSLRPLYWNEMIQPNAKY